MGSLLDTMAEDALALSPVLEEAARLFFQSSTSTVNLVPAAILLVLLLLALPLLGLPLLPALGLGDLTGSGGGTSGYGPNLLSRGDDLDTRISDLREQISQLEASNEALSNQVYYSGPPGPTTTAQATAPTC